MQGGEHLAGTGSRRGGELASWELTSWRAGGLGAGERTGYYPQAGFFAGANRIYAPLQKIFAIF